VYDTRKYAVPDILPLNVVEKEGFLK